MMRFFFLLLTVVIINGCSDASFISDVPNSQPENPSSISGDAEKVNSDGSAHGSGGSNGSADGSGSTDGSGGSNGSADGSGSSDGSSEARPELAIFVNSISEDLLKVGINSEISISYTSKNLSNCRLSFNNSDLEIQENPQIRIANESGSYIVTCFDSDGNQYTDAVHLKFNTTHQIFNGSETLNVKPTDVVFLIDTSGSMNDEIERLEETMPKFIEDLNAAFPNDSFQILVLAESSKIEINPNIPAQRFHKIDQEVKSHDSLEVFQEFSEECSNGNPNNRYANCILGDSQKEIVVVTDDESKDVSVSEFLNFVNNNPYLIGKTALNGFVGTVKEDKDWCTIKNVGQAYIDLAAEANTAGLVQHLCDDDYGKLLDNLKESIIEKNLQSEFELDYCIDLDEPINISINKDTPLSSDKYSIIENKKVRIVDGLEPSDSINISYIPKMCSN